VCSSDLPGSTNKLQSAKQFWLGSID